MGPSGLLTRSSGKLDHFMLRVGIDSHSPTKSEATTVHVGTSQHPKTGMKLDTGIKVKRGVERNPSLVAACHYCT